MQPERSLATVLFTDIVGSTERAAELRDAGWRDLRQEHDRRVRRELRRFSGHEINTAGDSFLATFEGPARAIACAGSIRAAVRELGLEVRAGLHMGEIERVSHGQDLGGLAVHIGARVAAEAGPGEILVSRSVHDALAGSAFDFEDRGARALKGVPGEWRLFAVTSIPVEVGGALPGRWGRLPFPPPAGVPGERDRRRCAPPDGTLRRAAGGRPRSHPRGSAGRGRRPGDRRPSLSGERR